jgi:hypothetical protein
VVAGALLRAAASVTLLMIGYYLALLDRLLGTGTLIEFVLALVEVISAWNQRSS